MQPVITQSRPVSYQIDSQPLRVISDNRTRHHGYVNRWRKMTITFALFTMAGLGFLYGVWLQSFGAVMYLEDTLDYATFDAILPALQTSSNRGLGFAGLITLGFLVALIVALVKLHRLGACVFCGRFQRR